MKGKTCASRAEASVKPVILFHTKLFRLLGRSGFYYFSELPTQHQPTSSLPASNPPSGCLPVPCNLKHQQSATHSTCYSSGFLASHPKISPQSCQLAVLLLPRKISATARVWPVFPTAIWSQRLSPARHESLTCNSAQKREARIPLFTAALWVFPRAVMRNVKQTPLIKGMFV